MRDWTRRELLREAAVLGAGAMLPVEALRARSSLFSSPPADEDTFRIGLVVPLTGPLAEGGRASVRGAELGAAEANHVAGLLGKRFELVVAPAAGPDDSEREARRVAEEEGVFALAGGLGEAACSALGEAADRLGVIFFNIGSPSDALRGEGCRRFTFHVEASAAMYADATAQWLVRETHLRRWHFVLPDTEGGERTYRRVRAALVEQGGEETGTRRVAPAAADPGPLLRELRRVGPDVVFLGLNGSLREAFLARYRSEGAGVGFEVTGPPISTLRLWNAPPESRAGVWPTLWHHKLFRYGAEQINDRFRRQFVRALDAHGWAGWMAVKALVDSVLRARTSDAPELVRFLERRGTQFDGHKGRQLTFRPWDHQLRQPVYLIRAKDRGEDRWDVFSGVAELPKGEPGAGVSSAEYLDRIGDGRTETACRFSDR
ncbi:MAG: ABC transporter substrate-binding protein [Gemmatimonadota bacterium]